MENLTDRTLVKSSQKDVPLSGDQVQPYLSQIPLWQIQSVDGVGRLVRLYTFSNFALALAFANQIGQLAEALDHHPAILVEWGKVQLSWWTHSVGGLHANDLTMAAKSDALYDTPELNLK